MTDEIRWRRAVKADRRALAGFACTGDRQPHSASGRRRPPAFPWEHEVQSKIREGKNIAAVDRILMVGEAADGSLVAVGSAWPDRLGYLLEFVAVSRGQRGRGIGRALIKELEREIQTAVDGRPVYVYGRVHPSNVASLALLRALHFTREPDLDSYDDEGRATLLFFSKIYPT